jgi:hypothetical protein
MKSLLVYLFLLFTSSVFSQIYVTNKSSEPIWVATVTYQNNSSFSGYVSNGWYKIIPGERKSCGGKLHGGDNTYYVHAHSSGYTKIWGSDDYFTVNKKKPFTIENCDMKYVQQDPNNKQVGFIKKFVHIGLIDPFEVEVSLK